MSTASLPVYQGLPSYTAEPRWSERRIALNQPYRPTRYSAEFVKQSRNGGVSLRLAQHENNLDAPVYGGGEVIKGTVELLKTDNVTSVEVKIEGTLQLQEIAEGGKSSRELCSNKHVLWTKGTSPCPSSLPFSSTLPATFSDGHGTYPLPPTYECHLTGFPGFRADIEYSVSVFVSKGKATIFGLGNPSISTRFVYFPRTRPATPLPPMLRLSTVAPGLIVTPEWRCFSSTIKSRKVHKGGQDIEAKLYIPASRIFSLSQPIPFYLTFLSSAYALAAFLPFGPTAVSLPLAKQHTQIRLLRQSIVDSANAIPASGAQFKKTEIWTTATVGEGSFKFFGDGPGWFTFTGEILVSDAIKNPGFKAAGLFVKDFISLTMSPPAKGPYKELQIAVPVQLTTDPWTASADAPALQYRLLGSESLESVLHSQPELSFQ